ncbi:MAG TPA: PadR family transcriptional regulator [Acidimicrobiales bacterium]|nr:PadR family transcriptional regulator [Acidimicrobiales bacterium]
MLELAILGLLEGQAMHGYEIRKRLRDELGQVSNVSFGSLYPALSRLERAGAVQATEDSGPGASPPVPMTGSLSGERAALRARRAGPALGRRSRKVYRITEEGRRQFTELLDNEHAAGADDARSFGLRLAFARYLPPHARLRLLERRRAHLVQRLLDAQAAVAGAEGRLDRYTRSLMEHTSESTERDIAWLDRLIEAERERAREAAAGVPPVNAPVAPAVATTTAQAATAQATHRVGAAGRTPRRRTIVEEEGEAR